MMQFVPYFLGEEAAPYLRATSVQKCVRLSGKHNDISELGRTRRHLTFFEMLGNFSFGDYFKEQAIPMAWELTTEVAGFDCGPEWGEPGGPAHGGGDRYVEFWNLVFPQYYRHPDRSLSDLPRKGIDTGAGLERWLMLLDGSRSVFETDVLAALVDEAQAVTGRRLGADEQTDVALRILADHARTMAFLVSDGVVPSNEDRGYVLRRVIRRAVRFAYLLGVDRPVTPAMIAGCVDVMGDAYPDIVA